MIFVCIKRSLLKNIFCFFFKQKTAYEMRISDWSSDVCSSDLHFRQLFNENFDVPAIGRFVIGRYWRAASPADQKAFLKVRSEERRVGKECVSKFRSRRSTYHYQKKQ